MTDGVGSIDMPLGVATRWPVDEQGFPNADSRLSLKEATYVGNIGGVDRPLLEYPLGWGEDALVDVVVVEERS